MMMTSSFLVALFAVLMVAQWEMRIHDWSVAQFQPTCHLTSVGVLHFSLPQDDE
jgi:DNA phosphorothioation-dependent restriction protein DptG